MAGGSLNTYKVKNIPPWLENVYGHKIWYILIIGIHLIVLRLFYGSFGVFFT